MVEDAHPVARFIQDVLPRIPGGPLVVTKSPGHAVLVRQAAQARGLTTRTIGDREFVYAGQVALGGARKLTTGLNSHEATAICRSKHLTKQMLDAAGLPTPAGIVLGADQFDQALARLQSTGRPAVLKPMSQARGEGVTCAIITEADLTSAWARVARAARRAPDFLLEEQVDGIDIRVHVVGRRVVAVATRLPAHVIGDGRRDIAALVELKQGQRDRHAYLAKSPIIVEPTLLSGAGWTLHDIPADGAIVLLNGPANVAAGGEPVDVTGLVHPDLLALAVDAARAIPGLRNAGVDLMAPDLDTLDGAVVLEINVFPDIRVHHQPAYGRARDSAGAIVDEMIAAAGVPARVPRRTNVARRLIRYLSASPSS